MKITLTAMLAVAAVMGAVDTAWTWNGYANGVPREFIKWSDPGIERFTGSGASGVAGSLGDRTYGIRCTLTAAPDGREQRRPLRWLLRRCRPWAA